MDGSMIVLDMDVAVTVNWETDGGVRAVCTIGSAGVSYISGALCAELGIARTSLKSSITYQTMFPGEALRQMSVIPTLRVRFPSGFEVTHGPWVVDDAAPVPMQTGFDFICSTGGINCCARGVVFVKNPANRHIDFSKKADQRDQKPVVEVALSLGATPPRLLTMYAPEARTRERCTACPTVLKGMTTCSTCSAAGRGVCPVKVRYCSRECQKSDWPRHKLYCGKAEDPMAAELKAAAKAAAKAATKAAAAEAPRNAAANSTPFDMLCALDVGGFPMRLNRGESVMESVRRFMRESGVTRGEIGGAEWSAEDPRVLAVFAADRFCNRAHRLLYNDNRKPRTVHFPGTAMTHKIDIETQEKADQIQALGIYEACRLVPEACFQLGLCYGRGIGVRKDLNRAEKLYREASEDALSLAYADVFRRTGPRTIVEGAVTGACITAFKAKMNLGVIMLERPGGRAEACMHFRIAHAYFRCWPGRDNDFKEVGKLMLDLRGNMGSIDKQNPSARNEGEAMAEAHFAALEDQDPLALYFRAWTLLMRLESERAGQDEDIAASLSADLSEYGFLTKWELLQRGALRPSKSLTVEEIASMAETIQTLLNRAVTQGQPDANLLLGNLLQQDNRQNAAVARLLGIRPSPDNYLRARRCFARVDACDLSIGTHNLGRMYQFGLRAGGTGIAVVDGENGVDIEKAIELFGKASDRGWHNSTLNLAGLMLSHRGDKPRCVALLRRAIQDGCEEARPMAERVKQVTGVDAWDDARWGAWGGGGGEGRGGEGGGAGGDAKKKKKKKKGGRKKKGKRKVL